ncbi:MAG: hypothetical protein K0U36_06040, partial [Alphaproteobacteria bacterium]|nr:hypothetical protein [Alphaproteobacteria bacterium]
MAILPTYRFRSKLLARLPNVSTDVHPPRTDFDSALQPVADRQAEAGRATKYIFITGGVVSSLGKGIASASIGALLLDHGYSVRLCKLDPYLNVDPGTMSPYEHGEVFVTDDGAETDLDIGHYERFTNQNATRADNTTTGRIYQKLIEKERSGDHF